jgi:ribosomal protein S18 acetylase RimI-like enzyme
VKSFQIRPISVDDSNDAAHLMCMLGDPTTAIEMGKRIQKIISHPDYFCFVSQENGKVHGMIGIQKSLRIQKNGQNGRILTLIVDDKYRNKGIGQALVSEAEKCFNKQGITSIIINSSQKLTKAHKFYDKLGYSITGIRLAKRIDQL